VLFYKVSLFLLFYPEQSKNPVATARLGWVNFSRLAYRPVISTMAASASILAGASVVTHCHSLAGQLDPTGSVRHSLHDLGLITQRIWFSSYGSQGIIDLRLMGKKIGSTAPNRSFIIRIAAHLGASSSGTSSHMVAWPSGSGLFSSANLFSRSTSQVRPFLWIIRMITCFIYSFLLKFTVCCVIPLFSLFNKT